MGSITQSNIPKASAVTVSVKKLPNGTLKQFENQTTAISPSGGEYEISSFSALNGDVFTNTGTRAPHVMEFTTIYTDGETTEQGDLYDYLKTEVGKDVEVVYKPKGASSGITFTLTGVLYRLDVPSASADDNSMTYTWAVSGSLALS